MIPNTLTTELHIGTISSCDQMASDGRLAREAKSGALLQGHHVREQVSALKRHTVT